MLVGMKNCSQDLLVFIISFSVLVLLVGKLFLRPGSFKKTQQLGFARVVTQGW